MIARDYAEGTWRPSPGAAPAAARVRAQALADVRATLRNGEQLLLTLVIPLLLLVGLTLFDAVPDTALTAGQSAINVVAPSIIALAVMSTAFTSLAISTGFDRRSGALRLLATTPLTRGQLVLARTIAVLLIEVLQIILIAAVALALGWRPSGEPVAAVLLVLVGTLAFATWGVALAGLLRAEATLAAANAIYLVLLLAGGVAIPQSAYPAPLAAIVSLLPSGALAGGLRQALTSGGGWPLAAVAVLAGWAVAGYLLAARTFKWE